MFCFACFGIVVVVFWVLVVACWFDVCLLIGWLSLVFGVCLHVTLILCCSSCVFTFVYLMDGLLTFGLCVYCTLTVASVLFGWGVCVCCVVGLIVWVFVLFSLLCVWVWLMVIWFVCFCLNSLLGGVYVSWLLFVCFSIWLLWLFVYFGLKRIFVCCVWFWVWLSTCLWLNFLVVVFAGFLCFWLLGLLLKSLWVLRMIRFDWYFDFGLEGLCFGDFCLICVCDWLWFVVWFIVGYLLFWFDLGLVVWMLMICLRFCC